MRSLAAILTTILFALCAGMAALAQAPLQGYLADPDSGCKVWAQNPVPKQVVRWSGACVGGYAEGPGTVTLIIEGAEFQRLTVPRHLGKASGPGVADYANGAHMEGTWKDGVRHGHFVVTFRNGTRFETDYRNGAFSRRGTVAWPDGTRYEGEITEEPKPNGQGRAVNPTGQVYQGQWKNGCFQGTPRAAIGVPAAQCGIR